jgi:mRNA interferase RelE/StbE
LYRVIIEREPTKRINRLPKADATSVAAAIRALAEDPRPFGYIRLSGFRNLYRLTVGNYRIVYQIRDKELLVVVVRLRRRNERTYKGL